MKKRKSLRGDKMLCTKPAGLHECLTNKLMMQKYHSLLFRQPVKMSDKFYEVNC